MRPATALAVAALVLTGCAGGDERPAVSALPAPLERPRTQSPGHALLKFLEAARARDAGAVWGLLSRASRARAGSRKAAAALAGEIPQPSPTRAYEIVLAERITEKWAVAAATAGRASFATALRRQRGAWKVEMGGPVRVRILRPESGEKVKTRTQVAAEVEGTVPITEAGLWLDGVALPSKGGRTPDGRALTMFAEADRLRAGRHTAIAFAAGADAATARAWTFTATGAGLDA